MADSSPFVFSGARGVIGSKERDLLSSPFRRVPFGFWGVCLFVCLFFVLSFEEEGMCLIDTLLTCRNTTARHK